MTTMSCDKLILVEVIPLINCIYEDITPASPTESFASNPNWDNGRTKAMSAPLAKLQLIHMSRQRNFSKGWLNIDERVQLKSRRLNQRGNNETSNKTCDHEKFPCRRGLWMRPDLTLNSTTSCDECKHTEEEAGGSQTLVENKLNNCHHGTETLRGNEADETEQFHKLLSGTIYFRGKRNDTTHDQFLMLGSDEGKIPLTFLDTDDPLDDSKIPCILKGYMFANRTNQSIIHCNDNRLLLEQTGMASIGTSSHYVDLRCTVCDGTALQILPPIDMRQPQNVFRRGRSIAGLSLHSLLSGRENLEDDSKSEMQNKSLEPPIPILGRTSHHPLLSSYDSDTVAALATRMSTMANNTVWIGTTARSLDFRRAQEAQFDSIKLELEKFWDSALTDRIYGRQHSMHKKERINLNESNQSKTQDSAVPLLLREGALLIHNSQPHSGKTTLVAAIAKNVLQFDSVHVLSAPTLFAKYGTSADIALETVLHELALRGGLRGSSVQSTRFDPKNKLDCAMKSCRKGKVCIILDHFETFIPPTASSQRDVDPYLPVLNSMASIINRLVFSLKTKNEFPFPRNPLYNVFDSEDVPTGFAVPIGFCLVGVLTCSEDMGQLHNHIDRGKDSGTFRKALDSLGGGKLHIPLPSATTRLNAFRHAFEFLGVKLDDSAKYVLPEVAASATWAFGGRFLETAKMLRFEAKSMSLPLITEKHLKLFFVKVERMNTAPFSESALITADFPSLGATSGLSTGISFDSVGGNQDAKLALEDALALDPKNRRLLTSFGLQPPIAVLLYGPPGTGKTLLARSVAQSLSGENISRPGKLGGAFITLKASDVVRPEVGNSEKTIVSVFEIARSSAPSVVFIDEFQALFGDRGSGSFILGQLASTLLLCMDDISRWSESKPQQSENEVENERVVVLGATNTPWMIDKAFLRPGRFDRSVHVGLPTSTEREDILRVHINQMKLAPVDGDNVSPVQKICKSLAERCIGFSGADLAALCRAAAVRCLSTNNGSTGLSEKHFIDAFHYDVVKSSNDELVQLISKWRP